jgi:hypothetical protein
MKVFFTTTPRLRQEFPGAIEAIYAKITQLGHTHTSDYIIRVTIDEFYQFNTENEPVYYDEILESLRKADVVVFDTSIHSIGVGLLIKEALDQGKGVIALYRKGQYPFLLGGMKEDKLVVEEYTLETLNNVLTASFDYLDTQMDTRFNFFISPQIGNYLDWVAKKLRVPRAVYLRRLIEEDMKKNKDIVD